MAERTASAVLGELEAIARTLEPDAIPTFVGALETLKLIAWSRGLPAAEPVAGDDQLLDVDETAARMRTTRDWLRRHPELPFRVVLSQGQVRYSAHGLTEWIRAQCAILQGTRKPV